MKFINILQYLLFILPCFLSAQKETYPVSSINDSILKKANAVIRYCKQDIEIESEKSMVIDYTKVITVLNKYGDKELDLYKNYSGDSKILKIEAFLYDARGNEIEKYKKKDFKDVSAVSGFYSDDRVKYLDFTPRKYPYTIKYHYIFKTKTTLFIPRWYPIDSYHLGIESNEIIIKNPRNQKLNVKEENFEGFDQIENLSSSTTIHYKIQNVKAEKGKKYSPYFHEKYPYIKFYLEDFTLKGFTANNINTWKDFGKWQKENLYDSQFDLTRETIYKIRALVKDIPSPIERAKVIYNYLQNKTRYIYVGLGIGGWQPNSASEVNRLGYGDCKGLTYYTKVMMEIAEIKAYCSIVYAGKKRSFDKEYSGNEGNHMILNLPELDNGKDVWLECTSQTLPFGFLGDFTDDRDVLVITDEGGVIKHTPKYTDENNITLTRGTLFLDAKGSMKGELKIFSEGLAYDDTYRLENYTTNEVEKHYTKRLWSSLNNLQIKKYKFKNDKEQVAFNENLEIEFDNCGKILGSEIIFSPNMFNKYKTGLKKVKHRKLPVVVKRGYVEQDSLIIKLPEGYSYKDNFEHKIESKFGSYKISIKQIESNKVLYTRRFYKKEVEYSKETYNTLVDFYKKVEKNDKKKILIKKV